jgi:hypothetical protein
MHHEESPEGRSHWDDLAEQLGLPPENASPASSKLERPEPSTHPEPSNQGQEPWTTDEKPAETLDTPEATVDAETGPEEDRPARRRRGRRGGRRHREGRESTDSEKARRPRSSSRGEKRPRKTRRPRADEPKSADTVDREIDFGEAPHENDLEPQAPRIDLAEADDEEIEKISDWNIPSWTEIVSGLYRPSS